MQKDYFQEAILNIWKSLPSFKEKSSMKTWMYRITINVCLGLDTKRKKVKLDFVEFIDDTNFEKEEDKSNLNLNKLRRCISRLDKSNTTIISLYLEGLAYKEIAKISGLTENHVAVKVKRIKKKLLNCINQPS
jgi:RNA polymerase sigma-70 factor (ECF subfamily)